MTHDTRHKTANKYNRGAAAISARTRIVSEQRITASAEQPVLTIGPVEAGVEAEVGPGAQVRPGLAHAALPLVRVIDYPKVVSHHAATAKVLASLLEKLHPTSAHAHRRRLAVVRAMSRTLK